MITEMVSQILELLVSNHALSISVHVQYQCFHYAVTWENDHQRSKKSALSEIDVQMASIHLFLIILTVFIMICIRKDAQLAQNLSFRYAMTEKISGPKITQGVRLQLLLLLWNTTLKGLTNHIRNIPKRPYTQLQGGF